MPSREVIRPHKRDKWRAEHAEHNGLTGDQFNVGKSFAAGSGPK